MQYKKLFILILFTLSVNFSESAYATHNCDEILSMANLASKIHDTRIDALLAQKQSVEVFKKIRAEILADSPLNTDTINKFNKSILKASFTKFKQNFWRRINPYAEWEYLLNFETTWDLLILDNEAISYSNLAIDAGMARGFNNLYYFNEIAPKVKNKIQLEALLLGLKNGFDNLAYFESVALTVKTKEQLTKIHMGFDAKFDNLQYYYNIVGVNR